MNDRLKNMNEGLITIFQMGTAALVFGALIGFFLIGIFIPIYVILKVVGFT